MPETVALATLATRGRKKMSRRLFINVNVLPFVWKSSSHWHQLLRCLWHQKKTFRCSIRDESRRTYEKLLLYWFDYQTICMFLERFHGITISLRTLKRRLGDRRLNKIGSDKSDASLQVIIEREVSDSSSLKGYQNI